MITKATTNAETEIIIYTLTNEDGSESDFEFLSRRNVDGHPYVALTPLDVEEDEDEGSFIVLKVVGEDGDEVFEMIEDEEEFDRISDIFEDEFMAAINENEEPVINEKINNPKTTPAPSTYPEYIDYELLEKKDRAKKNLGLFFGVGIVGAIILMYFLYQQDGGTWKENAMFVIFAFFLLVYMFGSMAIACKFLWPILVVAGNAFTFCVFLAGITFGGVIAIGPYILIRDIYYLVKKR